MDSVDSEMDRIDKERLISRHGGYRKLKSFQVAKLVYDVTVRFCDKFISRRSRTHDQMVQAARSGVQNIAEGSQVSGTSRKMELKLTSVARASLEELRQDYEDFLRQRGLPEWDRNAPPRVELIARRPQTADDVIRWAQEVRRRHNTLIEGHGSGAASTSSTPSTGSTSFTYPEIVANGVLTLIAVASSLLDRQLAAQARAFKQEGGFTERLYRTRSTARRLGSKDMGAKPSGSPMSGNSIPPVSSTGDPGASPETSTCLI